MPDRKKKPTKVIIAASQRQAEMLREVFGLSPDEWQAIGVGGLSTGSRFDVVVSMVSGTTREMGRYLDWFRTSISTRCTVDAKMIIL
jgi:hypothetical protein